MFRDASGHISGDSSRAEAAKQEGKKTQERAAAAASPGAGATPRRAAAQAHRGNRCFSSLGASGGMCGPCAGGGNGHCGRRRCCCDEGWWRVCLATTRPQPLRPGAATPRRKEEGEDRPGMAQKSLWSSSRNRADFKVHNQQGALAMKRGPARESKGAACARGSTVCGRQSVVCVGVKGRHDPRFPWTVPAAVRRAGWF